jgi:hypothetical protein
MLVRIHVKCGGMVKQDASENLVEKAGGVLYKYPVFKCERCLKRIGDRETELVDDRKMPKVPK